MAPQAPVPAIPSPPYDEAQIRCRDNTRILSSQIQIPLPYYLCPKRRLFRCVKYFSPPSRLAA
jgi:hypothetical protein